jgi:TonB family protein
MRRQSFVVCGLLVFAASAQAQLGPSSPRAVVRHMPTKAPAMATFNAEAELRIATDGDVDSVTIVTGSGDEAFDKQWKKSMSDWQFVPAVDAAGQPAESQVRVTYKSSGGLSIQAGDNATRNAVIESERIARMTCRDYSWEYFFVTNALPRRLALLDPLLKTPLVMLAAESPLTEAQSQSLRERYDQLISDAIKQCRDDPEAAFWTAVFKPNLQSALANP